MKTPKKRFKTKEEIEASIDKCYKDARRLDALADEKELSAKEFFRLASSESDALEANNHRLHGKKLMVEVERHRKRSSSLIDTRAKRFGKKLAEFMTVRIFTEIGDDSVSQSDARPR